MMVKRKPDVHRASTLRVNVNRARHLTFDFVNDDFVSVTRSKSTKSKTDDTNKSELGTVTIQENVTATESSEITTM